MAHICQSNVFVWTYDDNTRRIVSGKAKNITKVCIKSDKTPVFDKALLINHSIWFS